MVPHERCRLGGVLAILAHSYPGRQAVAARVCSGESATRGVTQTAAQLMYAKRNRLIKETGEDVAGDDVRPAGSMRQPPRWLCNHTDSPHAHPHIPARAPPLLPAPTASTSAISHARAHARPQARGRRRRGRTSWTRTRTTRRSSSSSAASGGARRTLPKLLRKQTSRRAKLRPEAHS
jgi:hypothetical protein